MPVQIVRSQLQGAAARINSRRVVREGATLVAYPYQYRQLTNGTKGRSARHDEDASLRHRTCAANISHHALVVDPAVAAQ